MRPLAVVLALLVLVGCNTDEQSTPPPPDGNANVRFLDGGRDAFEAYLETKSGKPVVVNKWASWCGPCRFEFPFLRSQARKRDGKVVFVGVNSLDNLGDARDFLADHPVPFPHFEDPDQEIAQSFNAVQGFPVTAYYDSRGRREYVHFGNYASEADLAEDIDKYAR